MEQRRQRRSWQGVGVAGLLLLCACGGGLGLGPPPPFPEPPVWDWTPGFGWLEDGAPTSDTLVCRVAPNLIQGDLVRTPTYNGRLTGPTLRIRPGDTFHLDICNRFPDNPPAQRAGPMGAFPHDPFTTNFHTHGLTTDPGGISDNVLRHMEPGTRSPVEVCIPAYHPAGTMWYHPHKHGSVSYQLFGGMAGFLIVQGGPGTLDDLPAVQAAREVVMAFQGIQVDVQGTVPWVNTAATAFAGGPNGLWAPFEGSTLYATTNGVVNPQLVMRPGEVQRWRWLNAFSGHTLCLELEGHDLHVVAQDGLTVPAAMTVPAGMSYVLGAGNRADVMVRAGAPGTYVLRAVDPLLTPKSISAQGVAPGERRARIGGSFPPVSYPLDLVTVRVEGTPVAMDLPSGSLPVAPDLGTECVLDATPSVTRHVEFEICPDPGNELDPYLQAICDVYRPRYGAGFWGGTPFNNLLMMLDRDDHGLWQKAGLFTPGRPLFGYPGDVPMFGGAIEEWVVSNRTASDHPFHIHVNPFLVTHVNGVALPEPEWRDTVLVPARFEDANGDMADGSVRFRTHYDPNFFGVFVMHCHILTHEDVGMMQEVEIVPGRGDRCPPHPFACTPADPFILVPQPCGDEPGPVR